MDGSFSSNYGWLNMIAASSVASERSPCNLKNVLRVETVRHRKDEEYERFIVAVPFHTPPQWGAVVSIVSALLVAGKAGEGSLRQREVRRLAPDSSACHRCKPCITTQSFNMFLDSCTIRVCNFRLRMAMNVGTRPIRSLDARTLDSRYCTQGDASLLFLTSAHSSCSYWSL